MKHDSSHAIRPLAWERCRHTQRMHSNSVDRIQWLRPNRCGLHRWPFFATHLFHSIIYSQNDIKRHRKCVWVMKRKVLPSSHWQKRRRVKWCKWCKCLRYFRVTIKIMTGPFPKSTHLIDSLNSWTNTPNLWRRRNVNVGDHRIVLTFHEKKYMLNYDYVECISPAHFVYHLRHSSFECTAANLHWRFIFCVLLLKSFIFMNKLCN